MSELGAEVHGQERLLPFFDEWPSFHDAEVIDLHLWRGHIAPGEWDNRNVLPVLTTKIRVLEATQSQAAHAGNDVLVTLRFHDVDGFRMEAFNHCNQIVALTLRTEARGKFSDGTDLPPWICVEFEQGFGMKASFRCFRVEVVEAASFVEEIGSPSEV